MFIDNWSQDRVLGSASLASILTSLKYETRRLVTNTMIIVQNQALWLCTGNSPRLSNEMVGRTVRIRIVPGVENPGERNKWKHDDLLAWTRKHRAALVRSLLILIRTWIQVGMPRCRDLTIGGFENWVEVMGGILTTAGIPGFLENMDDFREQADEEIEAWRDFVAVWHEQFGLRPVLPKTLAELCMAEDLMLGLLRDGSPRSRQTQMGNLLKGARDRVFNEFRIVMAKDARHRGRWYRLQPMKTEQSGSSLRVVGGNDVQ